MTRSPARAKKTIPSLHQGPSPALLPRRTLCLAGLSLPFAAWAAGAAQDSYPAKPARLIVASTPGGILDSVGRVVARGLSERLGQPYVVENKAGAGGILGTEAVAKAPADGYTLGKIATSHVINPSLYAKLPYDTLRDLAPVSQTVRLTNLLVVAPDFPANSLGELIAVVKARPNQLSYASSGNGQSNHLSGAMFCKMANLEMTHVPYKGGADALTSVLSGVSTVMFVDALTAMPHVRAGKLKVIAATGLARSKALPQFATLGESGLPGFDGSSWLGVVVPGATPRPIVDTLSRAIAETLKSEEVSRTLLAQGVEPVGSSPVEFRQFMETETVRWREAARVSGARVE